MKKAASIFVVLFMIFGLFTALAGAQDFEKDKSWRTSQLTGMAVTNQQGQQLGKVQDIVVDKKGELDYLVLQRQDGNFVPIPWNTAQPQVQNKNLVVSLSQDQLKNAPNFSANSWPKFDQDYEQKILSYYGE